MYCVIITTFKAKWPAMNFRSQVVPGHGSVMMVALICGFPKVGDPQDHGLQYENSH